MSPTPDQPSPQHPDYPTEMGPDGPMPALRPEDLETAEHPLLVERNRTLQDTNVITRLTYLGGQANELRTLRQEDEVAFFGEAALVVDQHRGEVRELRTACAGADFSDKETEFLLRRYGLYQGPAESDEALAARFDKSVEQIPKIAGVLTYRLIETDWFRSRIRPLL